jgi:hypothetical protein
LNVGAAGNVPSLEAACGNVGLRGKLGREAFIAAQIDAAIDGFAGNDPVRLRQVGVLESQQPLGRGVAPAKIGGCRIVAELLVLREMSDRIDADAADAALEPEPHHIVNGAARLRVALSRERVAKVLNAIP